MFPKTRLELPRKTANNSDNNSNSLPPPDSPLLASPCLAGKTRCRREIRTNWRNETEMEKRENVRICVYRISFFLFFSFSQQNHFFLLFFILQQNWSSLDNFFYLFIGQVVPFIQVFVLNLTTELLIFIQTFSWYPNHSYLSIFSFFLSRHSCIR